MSRSYLSAGVLELCTQPLGFPSHSSFPIAQLLPLTCKISLKLLTSTCCRALLLLVVRGRSKSKGLVKGVLSSRLRLHLERLSLG